MKICKTLVILVLMTIISGCGNKNNSAYEKAGIIANLDDDGSYAFLEMKYPENVLVTTEHVYDAGIESSAAVQCEVYYYYNNEVKDLGTIESLSTAYPLSFTEDAIWAGDNTGVKKYIIKKGELEETDAETGEYESSQVIHFGCGAADCVNSIIKK